MPCELAVGLAERGVPVTHGLFDGDPARFRRADGARSYDLDDWDERREGLLVLLVTEGKGLYLPQHTRALDALATWPKVAWLDPREPRFWDAGTGLAVQRRIPVFPATADGLLALSRALLTEQGQPPATLRPALLLDPELPLSQRVVRILDAALPWAQTCSLLPSVPAGLAEALRRRFHPEIAPTAIGRFSLLPGTERDSEGLHLARDVRRILLAGCLSRRSDHALDEIVSFVRQQLESAELTVPDDSLARHARDGIRIRLELLAGGVPSADQAELLLRGGLPTAAALRVQLGQDAGLLRAVGKLGPEQSRQLERLGVLRRDPSPYPPDLVRIPAGPFRMGDPTEEGYGDERPRHEVQVSTFYIAKHPGHVAAVARGLRLGRRAWIPVRQPRRGTRAGSSGHQRQLVRRRQMVQRRARRRRAAARRTTPTPATRSRIAKASWICRPRRWTGRTAGVSPPVPPHAPRLPLADRSRMGEGGSGRAGRTSLPVGEPRGRLPAVHLARQGELRQSKNGTTPVGNYPANGYGLFDMAGNVWEWAWDRWDDEWYAQTGRNEERYTWPQWRRVPRVPRRQLGVRRREAALRVPGQLAPVGCRRRPGLPSCRRSG